MGLIRKAAFIGAGVYIGKHLTEKEENIKAAAGYAQGKQQFPPQEQQQYSPQQQQQYQPQGQQHQHAPQGQQRQPPAYVARDQGYKAPMQAGDGFQNRNISGYQPEGGAFRDEKTEARN
ncbi:hypothetical protein V499_00191 [Pseudogymnoascus sp. VKM F-103]|nr:hypothetical protein V499_00191 [Pseudogymnoascus sp. VKM F-103]